MEAREVSKDKRMSVFEAIFNGDLPEQEKIPERLAEEGFPFSDCWHWLHEKQFNKQLKEGLQSCGVV